MLAICYRCGASKSHPFEACEWCEARPQSGDELAESLLLSDAYLDAKQLGHAAAAVKSGSKIPYPAGVFKEAKSRIVSARIAKQKQEISERNRSRVLKALAICVVIAAVLYFHPWPHYQYA